MIELCWLWVIFLFTIPEIYYDDTLGAFLWGDLDHDQWSRIAHMVHQRNQWTRDQRGFIISIDVPWCILIQLTLEKCTLYRYWTFCEIKPPSKIVNIIGFKIISTVNKHYSTYDLLKYCLCSDIVVRLFFSQILPFVTT